MRVPTVRVLILASLVAAVVPAVPGGAAARPHRTAVPFVVTGRLQAPWEYLRQGHDARDAMLLARYDRLAHDGVDPALLTRAGASGDQSASASSGSDAPPAVAFLEDAGRLAGRASLLEERYVPKGPKQVLELVARDAATGASRWTFTDTLAPGVFEVAFGARVGEAGGDGVLVLRDVFDKQSSKDPTTLIALDGLGRTTWKRSLPPVSLFSYSSSSAVDPFGGETASFDVQIVESDLALRKGAPDLLVTTEHESVSNDALGRQTLSGRLTFQAVSQATGALRTLPGGLTSSDGFALGGPVGDQDGDGLVELVSVDGGSQHRATVRRAADGRAVWDRTDLTTHGVAWVDVAGPVTGARAAGHRVDDLAFATWPARGLLGVQLFNPVTGQSVDDPTAGTHGTVTLLAGGSGRTVWSKSGDWDVPLQRAGVPALAVASDLSSTSSTTVTAKLQLDAYDAGGALRWTRTWSHSEPTDPSGQDVRFPVVDAGPVDDLDGDGGLETLAWVIVDSFSGTTGTIHLVNARDARELPDVTSGFLFAGVTRHGHDRVRFATSASGVTISVLRGSDGARLFSRLVPDSRGITEADAVGYAPSGGPCAEVLVDGWGKGRTVEAVLAADGSPLWVLNRRGADLTPGVVALATPTPRPSC